MMAWIVALVAALLALAVFVDRRADLREAQIEARFPPDGQTLVVNGHDVHVVVKGEGPDLVMIHGAGGNSRETRFALEEALSDYRVFYVDRPGLGWSGTSFGHPFSRAGESPMEQAAILAAATEQLGVEDPIVVGHSFGGAVAMAWALEHPASAIVILSGATMPWEGKVNITYRILGTRLGGLILAPLISAFISDDYIRKTVEGVFTPQPAPDDYANGAAVKLTVRTASLRANNRQVNTLRPHIVEMAARYPELTLPIEIVHGDADPVTPLATHALPLDEVTPTSNLTVLRGIGHMPHHVAAEETRAAIDRAATRAGLRD